ncbi:MAG: hypothetical protein CSA36_05080 [Draconibacterium sp.]|nr:MAG: hypothetical protein CSA36_05080 [Draconibacterium sp.]
MKTTIVLLFLTFYITGFSQTEFAPIGAKWYFNQPNSTSGNYVLFESKKDSLIQGKNTRVIDIWINGTNFVGNEYLYQNGDSIFYYNPNYNSFFLLYNFSAKTGDTIIVNRGKFKPTKAFFSYQDSITDFKYKILSIDSVQISGQWVKRQKVASINNALWGFSVSDGKDYYILNRVGSTTYLLGIRSGIIPEDKAVICRCYHDSDFEFRNQAWNSDCDLVSAINHKKNLKNGFIYPNPFNDYLNVQMMEPIQLIEIFNVHGLKIRTINHHDGMATVNTSNLNNGYYILRITTNQYVYSKKLLKIN